MEENKITDYETMTQRGTFVANGYKFTVKPVYLGEEMDYLADVSYPLYPRAKEDGEEPTDKELSVWAMMLFKQENKQDDRIKLGLFEKFKRWVAKTFVKNYQYYSDNSSVSGLVKWIEKKVSYKGKPIKFYDLERKYGLTKSEIVKLFKYFQDLSGF